MRHILEARWEDAKKPLENWIWGAPTASGHVEPSTLKKQYASVFTALEGQAKLNDEKPVTPFLPYSLTHTFLERLEICDSRRLFNGFHPHPTEYKMA